MTAPAHPLKTGSNRRRSLGLLGAWAVAGPVRAVERAIVIASKNDTEGSLTGSMIAQLLEADGLPVARRLGLGPTLIVRSALISGEVDLYPEYTGNAAFFSGTETDPAWKSRESCYAAARAFDAKNGIVWLSPAPANNTWLIALNGAFARAHRCVSMVDFARVVREGRVLLAASTEFVESPAALASFEAAYGFSLPDSRIISLPGGDTAVTARAAAETISGVNAGMVYGTDGTLSVLDLVVMADERRAQIVYEVAPVARAGILESHPRITERLNPLFAGLDLMTLRRLNARIAVEGEPAERVAKDYLQENGFVR